jgi:hypothetical protein
MVPFLSVAGKFLSVCVSPRKGIAELQYPFPRAPDILALDPRLLGDGMRGGGPPFSCWGDRGCGASSQKEGDEYNPSLDKCRPHFTSQAVGDAGPGLRIFRKRDVGPS